MKGIQSGMKRVWDSANKLSGMIMAKLPAAGLPFGFGPRTARLIVASLLAVITVSIVASSFYFGGDEGDMALKSGDKATDEASVETCAASLKELADEIEILGQIVFTEKIAVSSKVSGRLARIHVHEGDRVTQGQLIAEIERLPLQITLSQQQSELDIARRAFDLSKAKYENALRDIEIKLKTIRKAEAELNDKRVSCQNMDRILKNKTILYEAGGLSESELRTLKTQHTSVATALELAKANYEIQLVGYRDEDLVAEGFAAPRSERERMELIKRINTKIERAELESAKSRIKQAENNIRATEILLKECCIRSPIAGLVASKGMEAGEMVKAESVIATLISVSSVYLSMNVSERDITKIKTGQIVSFSVDAVSDERFEARIRRITPVLDMKTRTAEVKAELRNPGYRLLPGMFARARIGTGERGKKLVIPVASIIRNEGGRGEVYIVKKGLVFRQRVVLGREYGEEIEVSEGLHENDRVVAKGLSLVYEGMKLGGERI